MFLFIHTFILFKRFSAKMRDVKIRDVTSVVYVLFYYIYPDEGVSRYVDIKNNAIHVWLLTFFFNYYAAICNTVHLFIKLHSIYK